MGYMILFYGDFVLGFDVPDIRYVHSFINRQRKQPDEVHYCRNTFDKPKLVFKNNSWSERDWGYFDSEGYHEK